MKTKPARPRRVRAAATERKGFLRMARLTEEEYFDLCDSREDHPIIEYVDGRLEVVPVPTQSHQFIMQFFFRTLDDFVRAGLLGWVIVSGYKIRLKLGKKIIHRGPDVMFMLKENNERRHETYWDGADLAMEASAAAARTASAT